MSEEGSHTLESLLAFNGQIHWYAKGYFTKFEIKQVTASDARPHGLRYSLTPQAPGGRRLPGFDNAHAVPVAGSRFVKRQAATDHWHRTESDMGRPYVFTDAATLVSDFFAEVKRALGERRIPTNVVETARTTKRRAP